MEQITERQMQMIERQAEIPPLPAWPTSRPGPLITEPPPGQRRVHLRSEQVVEINYDEERGKSGVREA